MNILKTSNINTNCSFGSKNCPIESFTIQTKNGPLHVEELSKRGIYQAGAFTFNITVNSIPVYEKYRQMSNFYKLVNISVFADITSGILKKKDGNSTILVAKDAKNKIRALFSMQNFDKLKDSKGKPFDLKIGSIEDCLIDENYRNEGIGSILLNKLLKTANGYFTDIVLIANNRAVNFYKRAGFTPLDKSNPSIDKIKFNIPGFGINQEFVTLMSKSLVPSKSWWERAVTFIS